MVTIDEDKLREEIEGYIECELYSEIFSDNVNTLVWLACFENTKLTDEDTAAITKVYDPIFKEYLAKMLKALKH